MSLNETALPPSSASDTEKRPEQDSNESPPRTGTIIKPQHRRLHDPEVTFEEYRYYALKTREEEKNSPPAGPTISIWKALFKGAGQPEEDEPEVSAPQSEQQSKALNVNLANRANRLEITDEEWTNASRMMRTASWGACWYLITTDILGPYGVGFALGTLGWGPGVALYTVFGIMAGYSGWLLWKMFLGLDSYEFPLKNYGDLAFRIYGPYARHFVNILQGLLLLLVLGQVIIQNGQGISQVSRFRLCYSVCCVVFVAVGYLIGQVRTLRNYGWLANTAVWLNLMVIFITMGVMAHSPPNYAISVLGSAGSAVDTSTITPDPKTGIYPPVRHYGGLPDSKSLVGSLNGLLQGVFAYGGAQLFVEFMAEMRRPFDFFKAMWGAQFFIYSVYLIYGCYVYHFQGQYAYQVSYQGVSRYGWQVVGDMLACVSGLISAGLYGNIGIKVFYNNVLMDLFRAPPLTHKGGKILWAIIVPIWWSIAYVVAAAIPDYFGFVSVISAATVVQFTYSFPPILALGYNMKLYALKTSQGDGFDPTTGTVVRQDTGLKRLWRGLVNGPWIWNVLHVLYGGGALATAGLGMYAAVEGMIEAFQNPQVNAFTCVSPLDLSQVS
ncbi:hypothetical protein DTO027B5_5915 [Paecilomyces variotii]|nr:hypothetical protein DTO169C6_3261 [Paecilomyces variotii]KAJ9323819.1 hypothetical protein DTO027B3_5168 [Paecilomyces variotii]KAJ9332265.1 hypothetical protein DTO027B5_5915 [Paecilomyces variotii]KAJ9356850.1 hypothetical protein DTO027B9_3334 [Paecilomyces variotii]